MDNETRTELRGLLIEMRTEQERFPSPITRMWISVLDRALARAALDGEAGRLAKENERLRAKVVDLNRCLDQQDAKMERERAEHKQVTVTLQRLTTPREEPKPEMILPKCWNPPLAPAPPETAAGDDVYGTFFDRDGRFTVSGPAGIISEPSPSGAGERACTCIYDERHSDTCDLYVPPGEGGRE